MHTFFHIAGVAFHIIVGLIGLYILYLTYVMQESALGYHLKTGHTLSVQNRPTGLAEDVIVLPCFSVRLQGADFVVEAVLDF